MEDLNQRQLVLLVILVSFVTSIATGIMTVSLLDYAPPVVTQKVERVIERTVEYVSPQEENEETVVTEIREVIEQRIIDRGDDIIIETNKELRPAGVSIFDKEGGSKGRGVILSEKNVFLPFVSDKDSLFDISVTGREDPVEVEVLFSSGRGFSVAGITDDEKFPVFKLAKSTPKIGATVLHIKGGGREEMYVGRVAWLDGADETGYNIIGVEGVPITSPGAFLANLSGEIWGVQLNGVAGQYLPVSVLIKAVLNYEKGDENPDSGFEEPEGDSSDSNPGEEDDEEE